MLELEIQLIVPGFMHLWHWLELEMRRCPSIQMSWGWDSAYRFMGLWMLVLSIVAACPSLDIAKMLFSRLFYFLFLWPVTRCGQNGFQVVTRRRIVADMAPQPK